MQETVSFLQQNCSFSKVKNRFWRKLSQTWGRMSKAVATETKPSLCPWEVQDEPVWERPVVLMSACSESWKMVEHLHSRLELNKCNIPECEKGATLYHLGDRKALQVLEFWLKPPYNGSEWVPYSPSRLMIHAWHVPQNGIPHWIYERTY